MRRSERGGSEMQAVTPQSIAAVSIVSKQPSQQAKWKSGSYSRSIVRLGCRSLVWDPDVGRHPDCHCYPIKIAIGRSCAVAEACWISPQISAQPWRRHCETEYSLANLSASGTALVVCEELDA